MCQVGSHTLNCFHCDSCVKYELFLGCQNKKEICSMYAQSWRILERMCLMHIFPSIPSHKNDSSECMILICLGLYGHTTITFIVTFSYHINDSRSCRIPCKQITSLNIYCSPIGAKIEKTIFSSFIESNLICIATWKTFVEVGRSENQCKYRIQKYKNLTAREKRYNLEMGYSAMRVGTRDIFFLSCRSCYSRPICMSLSKCIIARTR